jgi:hypothetical protein
MTRQYVFIVSEDPLESPAAKRSADLALQLKERGNGVTFYLVQNGVFASRAQSADCALSKTFGGDIEVLADDFSLRERGIELNQLRRGVNAASIDIVVQRLAAGCRAIWS